MTSEENYQRLNSLILRAVGDGVYGLDKNGLTTFSNAAAEEMTGWKEREIIGKSGHAVLHHTKPDGSLYPCTECPIYLSIRDGQVHQGDDEIFWRKDGTSFQIEFISTPIFDGGELIGAVVVFRDITKRKIVEASLIAANEEISKLRDRLSEENQYLRQEVNEAKNDGQIIGESKKLKAVLDEVAQVAPTTASVMILGESGTGKELVARAIHDNSQRSSSPLIYVNCGAIPSGLVESELFGHEKGAFTGAIKTLKGKFELADGGTIFLDELADLPLETQTKLLRVLQEKEITRVGGTSPIKVDVRIIAATHKNLKDMVANEEFRHDLYYRLNVFPISLPPLRERVDDIPMLANYFLAKFSAKMGKSVTGFSDTTVSAFKAYSWPGNIREMQNIIERAVILAKSPTIDIPESHVVGQQELNVSSHAEHQSVPSVNGETPAEVNELDIIAVEKKHIISVLESTNWRISGPKGAAKLLNINPNTLRSRLRKYGIERP